MVLADEFDRLIAALEQAGAEYALAGGLAVAVWGAPRATCGFKLEASPITFRDGLEDLDR